MKSHELYNFTRVTESKLTSHEREELPKDMFGLPNERSYPLVDEEHVRKAIQFFRYCPGNQKSVLAANINRRARVLNMKVSISPNNPFYKFADRNVIKESLEYMDFIILENYIMELPKFECSNPQSVSLLDYVNNKIITTCTQMLDFEKELQYKIIPSITTLFKSDINLGLNLINPIQIINKIMKSQYAALFAFECYSKGTTSEAINGLFYEIISDISYNIYANIVRPNKTIKEQLSLLRNLVDHFTCNIFYIERYIQENLFNCCTYRQELSKERAASILFESVTAFEDQLDDFFNYIKPKESTVLSITNTPLNIVDAILKSSDMNSINIENYLNTMKNELKNQIDIILLDFNISSVPQLFNDDKTFLLKNVSRDNIGLFNIIDELNGTLISDNIKYYNKNYSLLLDDKDLITFTQLKYLIDTIYNTKDKNGDSIYFGIKDDKLYLLGKTNEFNKVILISLYDDYNTSVKNNLLYTNYSKLTNIRVDEIIINPDNKKFNGDVTNILTEGLSIDKDGNIKYELKPKKSYMDDYADNHRLLLSNLKVNNYEGAKKNLAFLFALISSIERDVIYSKKQVGDDIRKDAEKARTFAINDFKTYLKEVQKADPKFDFTKFYEAGGYDSLIINIPHDSVLGIKKLFRTIMWG